MRATILRMVEHDAKRARERASEAEHKDRLLDIELEQTFPASDPIPWIHEPRAEPAREAVPTVDLARRYLEDFRAGQRFVTGTVRVDAGAIKAFAAEFDPQPFHLDEAAAERSMFGGLCASGWHTGALTMRLLVESELRTAWGLVGLGGEVTWPRPVRSGDELKVEIEVLEVVPSRSKPDRGVVKARNVTVNQRGEPVQVAVMKLIVPRRPPHDDAS
jgi:acyl dehydratase